MRGAGEGTLEIGINGPSGQNIPNNVLSLGPSQFEVTFVPCESGQHRANITFNKENVNGRHGQILMSAISNGSFIILNQCHKVDLLAAARFYKKCSDSSTPLYGLSVCLEHAMCINDICLKQTHLSKTCLRHRLLNISQTNLLFKGNKSTTLTSYHICLLILVGAPSATALLQHGISFLPPSKIVRPI